MMPARSYGPTTRRRDVNANHSGTAHFVWQRLTAAASLVLVLILTPAISNIAHSDYEDIRAFLARPQNTVPLLALILFSVFHMGFGAQVIIDDYVSHHRSNRALHAANYLFCSALIVSCAIASVNCPMAFNNTRASN
ncbi:MAG: succinate dehydrogenase, hydrophobic membrane anchor protein [Amphiplicatus sp.]